MSGGFGLLSPSLFVCSVTRRGGGGAGGAGRK